MDTYSNPKNWCKTAELNTAFDRSDDMIAFENRMNKMIDTAKSQQILEQTSQQQSLTSLPGLPLTMPSLQSLTMPTMPKMPPLTLPLQPNTTERVEKSAKELSKKLVLQDPEHVKQDFLLRYPYQGPSVPEIKRNQYYDPELLKLTTNSNLVEGYCIMDEVGKGTKCLFILLGLILILFWFNNSSCRKHMNNMYESISNPKTLSPLSRQMGSFFD